MPIVERGGGTYTATFLGVERKVRAEEELETLLLRSPMLASTPS